MLPDCAEAPLTRAVPPDKMNTLVLGLEQHALRLFVPGFCDYSANQITAGNGVSGGYCLLQGNFVPRYWAGKWERVLSVLELSLLLFGLELCACENSSFLRTTKAPDNGLPSSVRNTLCL